MIDFPSNPTDGQVFTSGNSSWVWNAAASQWRTSFIALNPKVQRLSGNGTTVQFTLTSVPPNINFLDVYISGLYQQKNTYTVVGNVITFSEAPPTGTENIEVEWGSSLDVGVPSDASVTATKLASGAAVGNLGYTPVTLEQLNTKQDALGFTPVNKAGDTITGNLTIQGSNGAVTVRGASTGAQLKLERTDSSQGHSYIGADVDYALRVYNSSFVDSLRVTQSGYVIKPNQPSFKAYTINFNKNTTWQKLTGFTSIFNVSNCYNSSTDRFTAPITGLYQFECGGWSSSASNGERYATSFPVNAGSYFYISGSNYSLVDSPLTGHTEIIKLNAGDYVEFHAFSAIATTWGTSSHSLWWSGHLIG